MVRNTFDRNFKTVAIIKIMPEEIETHWRRTKDENEESYDSIREFLMAECMRYDKAKAAKGTAMNLDGKSPEVEFEPMAELEDHQWMYDVDGNEVGSFKPS